MNERIKLLAEQAFQPINDISTEGVADRYTFEQAWFQMYNQKFAELLIRECMSVAKGMRNPTNLNYKPSERFVDELRLHFGVQDE